MTEGGIGIGDRAPQLELPNVDGDHDYLRDPGPLHVHDVPLLGDGIDARFKGREVQP